MTEAIDTAHPHEPNAENHGIVIGESMPHDISSEVYLHKFDSTAQGPQLEGISPADLGIVLAEAKTEFISIPGYPDARWPLLTPISNNTEYLSAYFQQREVSPAAQPSEVLYLSLPHDPVLYESESFLKAVIDKIIEAESPVAYDEIDGQNKGLLLEAVINRYYPDKQVKIDELVDPKNGTPAAVIHYEGLAHIEKSPLGSYQHPLDAYYQIEKIKDGFDQRDGTTLLDPRLIHEPYSADPGRKVIDRMWEIYEAQFSRLVENHPARQAQTRDELESMLSSEGTITPIHCVDGEIVSFAMFVGDIRSCDWLNSDYIEAKFPSEDVYYFPGIATDENMQGNRYSMNLINLIAEILSMAHQNPRIIFQCTNISADYIPAIVEGSANATGIVNIEMSEYSRYNYRLLKIE